MPVWTSAGATRLRQGREAKRRALRRRMLRRIQRDVIRKEEEPDTGAHPVSDAGMLPRADDRTAAG
ncbi:hypothetical protein GCM10010372_77990 [Streptomyces tauricus]|nr:hypothetical protein GCM10010372_77990 [Streptomyces tauricus]